MSTQAETAVEIQGKTLEEATQYLMERYPDFCVMRFSCKLPPKSFKEEPGYACYPTPSGDCVMATHPNWGAWELIAFLYDFTHKDVTMVRDIPNQKAEYHGNFLEFYPEGYFPNTVSEEKGRQVLIAKQKKAEERRKAEEEKRRIEKEALEAKLRPLREEIKTFIRFSLSIYDIERARRLGDVYLDKFLVDVDKYKNRISFPEWPQDDTTAQNQYYLDCLLLWNDWLVNKMPERKLNLLCGMIKAFSVFTVLVEDGESYMTFFQEGFFFDGNKAVVIRGGR